MRGRWDDEVAYCVMCGLVVYREYPDLPPIREDIDENDNDLDSSIVVAALTDNGVAGASADLAGAVALHGGGG